LCRTEEAINPRARIVAAQVAAIERREAMADQTIWLKEIEAQEYGQVFEDFRDGQTERMDGVLRQKGVANGNGSQLAGCVAPENIFLNCGLVLCPGRAVDKRPNPCGRGTTDIY
jgi:hypothetical protein